MASHNSIQAKVCLFTFVGDVAYPSPGQKTGFRRLSIKMLYMFLNVDGFALMSNHLGSSTIGLREARGSMPSTVLSRYAPKRVISL